MPTQIPQLAQLERKLPAAQADWDRFRVELDRWRTTLQGMNWTAITLKNNWVAYGGTTFAPPAYYLDAAGRVFCRGLIKSGTVTDGTVLFTLPYTPSWEAITFAPAYSGGPATYVPARLDVQQSGNVVIYNAGTFTGGYFVSLDQLSFSLIQ
jgi:hypothetical protein